MEADPDGEQHHSYTPLQLSAPHAMSSQSLPDEQSSYWSLVLFVLPPHTLTPQIQQ